MAGRDRLSPGRIRDCGADLSQTPVLIIQWVAGMKYVCGAPERKTWFRLETEAEAEQESALMDHAVAKYFRRERDHAVRSYKPTSKAFIEQNIGLEAHVQRRCRSS